MMSYQEKMYRNALGKIIQTAIGQAKVVGYNLDRECWICAKSGGWGRDKMTEYDHLDINDYDNFIYVPFPKKK